MILQPYAGPDAVMRKAWRAQVADKMPRGWGIVPETTTFGGYFDTEESALSRAREEYEKTATAWKATERVITHCSDEELTIVHFGSKTDAGTNGEARGSAIFSVRPCWILVKPGSEG